MFSRWSPLRPLTLSAVFSVMLSATLSSTAHALPDNVDHRSLGHADLDLDALVAEALQAHPSLDALRQGASAQAEVGSRVGSLPDPSLSIGVSNFRIDDPALNTSPMTGVVFGLQQGIPWPGKLVERRRLADRRADVALMRILAGEAQVELNVRERYWELHYAQAALAVTEQNAAIVAELANVVTQRFSVGQAAQQDALQAMVAESHLQAMIEERQQALLTAQRELNSAVGRPPEIGLGATVEPPRTPVDADALRQRLVEANPSLAVAQARVAAAEAAVKEARSELVPDFAVGADYRVRGVVPGDTSNGADMMSVGLRVSVPLWAPRKQSALVREQRYHSSAATADADDVTLTVSTALEQALDQIERLDRETSLYRDDLIPKANQSLTASIDDYTVGHVGFVSVLNNWQLLLVLELDLERLVVQRAQQFARTRALVGGLPEVTQ